MRPGAARRALAGGGVVALAIIALAGCGGGAPGVAAGAAAERKADAAVLNAAIAREQTIAAAYEHGLSLPIASRGGPASRSHAALLRRFRAHAQEHIDALTKSMRGLGQPVEAEAEALEYHGVSGWRDFLAFIYGLESRTIRAHLHEISSLLHPWPRSVLGSIAAGEAQQLVLIRQELGARTPKESVPSAFEAGSTAAPPVTAAAR